MRMRPVPSSTLRQSAVCALAMAVLLVGAGLVQGQRRERQRFLRWARVHCLHQDDGRCVICDDGSRHCAGLP